MVSSDDKYSESVLRSSIEQFEKDFGEYPPLPLEPEIEPLTTFTLSYLTKFQKRLFSLREALSIFIASRQSTAPKVVLELFDELHLPDIFNEFAQSKSQLFISYSKLNAFSKPVFLILISILLIVLIPIVLAFTLFVVSRLILRIWSKGDEFDNVGGFYSPLPSVKRTIFINRKLTGENATAGEHVVSHEHIHFLQSYKRELIGGRILAWKHIRNPELLLSDKYVHDADSLYLLERDEVEARLHEIVISIYSKYRRLPQTIEGFVGALSQCEEIGYAFGATLFEFPNAHLNEQFDKLYNMRQDQNITDFILLLGGMIGVEERFRFAMEVLTVMYGNLLGYYGDELVSREFKSQISRPNLYDRLY